MEEKLYIAVTKETPKHVIIGKLVMPSILQNVYGKHFYVDKETMFECDLNTLTELLYRMKVGE